MLKKFVSRKNSEARGFLYNVFDVLLNVVIIVAVVAVIRTFVVSPFEVEGNSMIPTLENNQYIIINKFGYLIDSPGRGDVVVFRPPTDVHKYYVKRIIGLPGDTVSVSNGEVHLVNEDEYFQLEENYLDDRNSGRTFRSPVGTGDKSEELFTVPEDHFFVLGDNRQGSLDSRSFRNAQGDPTPYVHKNNISGRVWFVALPITKSHALEIPDYGQE
jgi:signal peptidase I